jgi:hypothetical protein
MTMPFSAAAAAALNAHAAPDHGVYSYSTEAEFMMKTTASNAPAILSLILTKLVLDVISPASTNQSVVTRTTTLKTN